MSPRVAHVLCLALILFQPAGTARAQFTVPTNFICGVKTDSTLSQDAAAKISRVKYAGTGARSVLVLRVDFPNAPGAAVSEEQARAELASADAFFRKTSFQQFSFSTVAVTPVLRLEGNTANTATLASQARAAAEAAGFDFSAYDFS